MQLILYCKINVSIYHIAECSKHCSLCYNETECYECTHGYFLNAIQECESKLLFLLDH